MLLYIFSKMCQKWSLVKHGLRVAEGNIELCAKIVEVPELETEQKRKKKEVCSLKFHIYDNFWRVQGSFCFVVPGVRLNFMWWKKWYFFERVIKQIKEWKVLSN